MKKILIVEDHRFLSTYLVSKIRTATGLEVDVARTFDEAVQLIVENDYFLALLDLELNQAKNHSIVDLVVNQEIPYIGMAGDFEQKLDDRVNRAHMVDFIIKESPDAIDFLIKSVKRVHQNRYTKVLVVEDSKNERKRLVSFVKHQLFQVYEASNGHEAINILEQDPEIKIVVTDVHMPEMDGISLLKYIRTRKLQDEMAVLGVSSDNESLIRLLKLGANDFIKKPFSKDEFVSRLNHLADVYEYIQALDELANRDFLTKLYSRKYFFEQATPYIYKAYHEEEACAVIMIDIDDFKKINDTYGHDIGDKVIKQVSQVLHDGLKGSDIVARYGGEEFCVLLKETDAESAKTVCENLREKMAKQSVRKVAIPNGVDITFTVSIGLNTQMDKSLEEMIIGADAMLYKAKRAGKNRVMATPVFELEEVV